MLKLKYLYENDDQAKWVLKNWPHDTEGLDELLAQFRISNNAIYPFRQGGTLCFLRLTPTEERLEKNLLGELEFVEYLNSHSYPALCCLPSVSGEKLLRLSTPWGSCYAAAFRGVPGVPLNQTTLTPEVMRAYGRALGLLHALAAQYQPNTKKWSHLEALDWIDRVLVEYGAPREIAAFSQELRGKLSEIPQTPANYGLIHYDFECDNVFYDPETASCHVIDFDDGMYHWYAMDMERTLSSLEEDAEELGLAGLRLERAESEFLCGYCEEYPYTQETELLRPLLRQFETLHTYAKLIRSAAEKYPNELDWMKQLRDKLDRVIAKKAEAILAAE